MNNLSPQQRKWLTEKQYYKLEVLQVGEESEFSECYKKGKRCEKINQSRTQYLVSKTNG